MNDELAHLNLEIAWSREQRDKDHGLEIISTMPYEEAKKFLIETISPHVQIIDRLQEEYKLASERYLRQHPKLDAEMQFLGVLLVWLTTGRKKQLDDALGRYSELQRYWHANERRKKIHVTKTNDQDLNLKILKAKEYPIENIYPSRLRRAGRLLIDRCPIHEDKSPSFTVYPNNTWYCFGCGEGGDSIDLCMQLHTLTFTEAVEKLS